MNPTSNVLGVWSTALYLEVACREPLYPLKPHENKYSFINEIVEE